MIVINALFVMWTFGKDLGKSKAEIRAMTSKALAEHKLIEKNVREIVAEAIKLSDKNNFEESFNKSVKDIANRERFSGLSTNIYARFAHGEYTLSFDNINYVLTVNDVFENGLYGVNEVKYNYSMIVIFDKERVISVNLV